jgi:hypothetical protein
MRCIFVVLLACLSLAPLSAQVLPSSSTASPPGASAAPLPQPSPTWQTLDDLLAQLEVSALDSSEISERLYQRLVLSETRIKELSTSLAQSESSLQVSAASLKEAQAQASRRSLEAGLWRVGTFAAGLGLVGALLDAVPLRGAGVGAGIGGVLGGVWIFADHWPPWAKKLPPRG